MSLLSIYLLCWPNYRSSLFLHRRKFVAKIFRLFFFHRVMVSGGKDSSRIVTWNPNKGVWISYFQLDKFGFMWRREDKGPKLLEHSPEIFKRVCKQYPNMIKYVHIYRKNTRMLNNSDTNGTWFCWWFGCSFCRMARCALGTPVWGHGASSYATSMRTKVRSYGWRFLGASMSQETSDCLVNSRVWELWLEGYETTIQLLSGWFGSFFIFHFIYGIIFLIDCLQGEVEKNSPRMQN